MGNQHKFGQTPPPRPTFNQQTMVPAASAPNPHFVPNQCFPPYQNNMNNYSGPMNNINNRPPMPQNLPFNVFNQNPQMQNINQLLQLQMLMAGNLYAPQILPFPQFHMHGLQQNVPFVGNAQMGFSNPGGVFPNFANSNGTPMGAQQFQGSSSSAQGTGTVPPLQNQASFHARPLQFQANQRNSNGTNNNQYKNSQQNPRNQASGNRNMKPRFQKMQNYNGNFSSPNAQMQRENNNVGAGQNSVDSAAQTQVQQKRSLALNYTDEEIRQWREERKKHFPSKANIEKKMEEATKPDVIDEAHLRRQRLKEVLAKQAELGCEVADIPSHYLLDSEQQVHDTRRGGKHSRNKEKFQNRFKKRGDKNGSFTNNLVDVENGFVPNKKRFVPHHAMKEREPTLLQKLLKADIQRDKHHLMQALRFMASNSFFENWPKSQLKFPPAVIKVAEGEDDLNLQEFTGEKNSLSAVACEQPIRENENGDYSINRQQNNETGSSFVQEMGTAESEEEEGEILD